MIESLDLIVSIFVSRSKGDVGASKVERGEASSLLNSGSEKCLEGEALAISILAFTKIPSITSNRQRRHSSTRPKRK